MLERAAAGLESRKLQQILSRSKRCSRPSPNFTRNFSRHHASSTKDDLHSQLSRLAPTCTKTSPNLHRHNRGESTGFLDFLYPKPTHTLLRQDPGNKDGNTDVPREPKSRFGPSITVNTLQDPAPQNNVAESTDIPEPQPENGKPPRWTTVEIPPKDIYSALNYQNQDGTVGDVADIAEHDLRDPPAASTLLELEALLTDPQGELYHDVWDIYCRLVDSEQTSIRTRVVEYLVRSQSVVETNRSISLLRKVDIAHWSDSFLSASVLTYLRSGDQTAAISTWMRGLEQQGLTGGFEYLLIDSVNKQEWETPLKLWVTYCKYCAEPPQLAKERSEIMARWQANAKEPDQALLAPLESLPSLGALYFTFERYLAKESSARNRQFHEDVISKTAFRSFRRRFAKEALRQPCPPKQASVILEFWRDHSLYNHYLTSMFDQWYRKMVPRATVRMLPEIYQKFRELEGAKPWTTVLRGMFKILYPTGVAELEQLRKDWICYYGELSHWAFEKFLRFYAHQGDVNAVRQLWERCIKIYPVAVKTPRGFRSILNVYAQNGDVEGVERELDRMINDFEVDPDIDAWNVLLKACVRADNYSKTLSTFDEICTAFEPDSFTYAHVMTMAAKKGDLETVIRHFNAAQKGQVKLTREMCLALVLAYCKNDQLVEAEGICRELALQGVSSTEIWNQLLHYNGMSGRLSKCYELLNDMKKFNLEWDAQTITYLLRALVQVNEIFPAYQVVRDSAKNKLHVLIPDHFSIVMLGAVKLNNRTVAEGLVTMMDKLNIAIPFNAKVAYARVAMQTAPNALRTPKLIKDLLASLQELAAETSSDGDLRRRKQNTSGVARAAQLLVECRDFDTVESLLTTFEEMFPQYQNNDAVNEDIVASLMLAYHTDENYDSVHELWRQTWPKILRRAIKPDNISIYPAHEYDVTRIMFRLVDSFAMTEDGDGLLQVVDELISYGFKFTSSTWDRIIRALARLGHWERAMAWCETLLMPEWQGWNVRRKPKPEIRRINMNSRILRPEPQAVMALQHEWLEMRKLAAWSSDVSRKLDEVAQKYPLLHHAFTNSKYMDEGEPWIFRGDVNPLKAITQLLAHLPLQELMFMQKTLEERLAERRHDEDSLFRTAEEEFGSSKAMRRAELTQLRTVLKNTLKGKRPTDRNLQWEIPKEEEESRETSAQVSW